MSEEKHKQVIALGQLGWSLRRIQRETGVRRETAAAYLKAAGIPVSAPGRPGGRTTAKPAIEVTTDSAAAKPAIEATTDRAPAKPAIPVTADSATDSGPTASEVQPSRSRSASACEPFHEIIEAALARGRNAMAIWQDLVDQSGFRGAYETVKRYVRKLRGTPPAEPRAVILTAPGEEAQVDYGDGPMVRDAATGKYRRARLFVMTLGFSRKSVRLLTLLSSAGVWCQLHERAFRRLAARPAWWCSTTFAKACSSPIFTILR